MSEPSTAPESLEHRLQLCYCGTQLFGREGLGVTGQELAVPEPAVAELPGNRLHLLTSRGPGFDAAEKLTRVDWRSIPDFLVYADYSPERASRWCDIQLPPRRSAKARISRLQQAIGRAGPVFREAARLLS